MADHLRIEDVECSARKKLQGDIYVSSQSIAFVAYPPGGNGLGWVFWLGIIGYVFRASKMEKWRDSLASLSVEEMVEQMPNSWELPFASITHIQKRFPNVLIIQTINGTSYRLAVPRQQDLKWFAEKQKLPIACWL